MEPKNADWEGYKIELSKTAPKIIIYQHNIENTINQLTQSSRLAAKKYLGTKQ